MRMFLLKPGSVVNAVLLYVLGLAANKYGIRIHAFIFLSDHGHMMATDPVGGQMSGFMQYLFSLAGRSLNRHYRRRENFWSSEKPNCVWIAPRAEDLADKLAYVLCNAVISGLVDRMQKWPGVKVTTDDLGRLTINAKRPNFFFSKKLPEEVTYTTCLPECEDATERQLIAMVRERCREIEEEKRNEMAIERRPFLGAKRAREVDAFDCARTPEPLGELEPHIACKDTPTRIKLIDRLRLFRSQYREALAAYCAGKRKTHFPWGTLKLVQYLGCCCHGPDPRPSLGAIAI